MKLLHISDLHFGKTLHECPLVEEDQPHWKEKFLELVDEIKPDAVLIAGDVYDRSTPSNEAVKLLDEFLLAINISFVVHPQLVFLCFLLIFLVYCLLILHWRGSIIFP